MGRMLWIAACAALCAAPAGADQSGGASAAGQGAVAPVSRPVDVSRLPVDLGRLQRRLKASSERADADGMKLRFQVDVYAPAPPIVLFSQQDNLTGGLVPSSAPSHADMMMFTTPPEHRGSATVMRGGINLLGRRK